MLVLNWITGIYFVARVPPLTTSTAEFSLCKTATAGDGKALGPSSGVVDRQGPRSVRALQAQQAPHNTRIGGPAWPHGSMHFEDGPTQITCTGPLSVNGDGHPPWSWAYFNREVREGSLSLVLFAEQRQRDKSCPKMSVTWTSLTTWD